MLKARRLRPGHRGRPTLPAAGPRPKSWGADVIIDPAKESPHGRWEQLGVPLAGAAQRMARMMGSQFGRPVVFECVGAPGVLQNLIESSPAGTQIVVAGVCMESDKIEPSIAITKEIELTFIFGYSPEEFAATLDDLAEGRIDVSDPRHRQGRPRGVRG